MSTQFSNPIADQQYMQFLQDAIDQMQQAVADAVRNEQVLSMIMAGVMCKKCGSDWSEHRGYDAACPNPLRHKAGWKWPFIEGQYFSATPQRCTHVMARNSEDTEGVPCRETCEPGKTMCPNHYEE